MRAWLLPTRAQGPARTRPGAFSQRPAELGGASRVLLLGMLKGFCSASVSRGSFPPLRLPCSLSAPPLSCRDFTDCLPLGWGPCESPLLASAVLAPSVLPARGTVSMNQRMIEWLPCTVAEAEPPTAPHHLLSPSSPGTRTPIFSSWPHGCVTECWPMTCKWKSCVWPSRKFPHREGTSPSSRLSLS